MVAIKSFIWDDWNKKHISKHGISIEEVEEVCKGKYQVVESYKKRILVTGVTK